MKFKIPFTISGIERQKKSPILFKSLIRHKRESKLQEYLDNTKTGVTREQYISIMIKSVIISFFLVFSLSFIIVLILKIGSPYLLALIVSLAVSLFVLFSQISYPKLFTKRKEREIERNLLPALQDMLVQLNSGVPIFSIMVNISSSDYSELSEEFKNIVKKINAGASQIEVLDDAGDKSSSIFFRRAMWQLSNGMKAGSDMSLVIQDSMKTLSEEQLIQVQRYGNKLNPLVMFYMIISLILPAIAITFLTIISSLVGLSKTVTLFLFMGMLIFVIFMQIVFLGLIKSAKPSLL